MRTRSLKKNPTLHEKIDDLVFYDVEYYLDAMEKSIKECIKEQVRFRTQLNLFIDIQGKINHWMNDSGERIAKEMGDPEY